MKGTFLSIVAALIAGIACPAHAQKKPDPALELYFAANAAYNRKLYPIAAGNFQKFLGQFPTHEKAQLARYGLGLSQFRLKQYDRAVNEFLTLKKAPKLDAKIERGRVTLLHAQCLLYSGKADDALIHLTAASANLPAGIHRTGAKAAVADIYFRKQDWLKTVNWTRRLQQDKPTPAQSIRAGYQEAFAQFKSEKFPDSVAVITQTKAKAVAAKSTAWVTRLDYLAGECHMAAGKLPEAEVALAAALNGLQGEDKVDCRYRLAMVKFDQKKWELAQADFELFLRENKMPVNEDARKREADFLVARCMMEQKEIPKADKRFNQVGQGNDEVAARAYLWRGRLYSRDGKYDAAVNAIRPALDKPWYKTSFQPKPGQPRTAIVADIDFEYAIALMLKPAPDWAGAIQFLARIQQRRGDYGQLAEVLSQQAICQHKLKQFNPSFQTTGRFIREQVKHRLIGDMRFLHAENLFLLNRLDEAVKAYTEFLTAEKKHSQRTAAEFRIAQVHHHKQQWAESNKRAVPILLQKPEGKLFEQISFVVGENYFRLGEWASAAGPFESFLALHVTRPKNNPKARPKVNKAPNVDAALMQLGVALARQNKLTNAIEQLEILVTNYGPESPHLPLALSEQGKLLYDTKQRGRARNVLQRFVNERMNKNNAHFQAAGREVGRVHYYLGWIDAEEKRFPQAAENFKIAAANSGGRKAKDGSSLAADAALQQGIAMVDGSDFANAARHLQQVANQYREHPRRAVILYYTGLAFAREKNWNAALGFFKQVVESHPKENFADKALYEWAWCERELKRNKEATARYELLLKQWPTSTLANKVQSELAELNLDAGAQDKVIASLTATMAKLGDSDTDKKLKFELEYQLASAHFKKKDYRNSAVKFEALIERGANHKLLPSIRFQSGEARLALTQSATARDHYLAASKLGGMSRELSESILFRLAETQGLTKQYQEAQKSYEKFLREYKESQWTRNARYGLGYSLEQLGQHNRAIGEYSQLLPQADQKDKRLDKWMVQARFQIGECRFAMKQWDQAMADFVSVSVNAQGFDEWRAKAILEMGRIYRIQNKDKEALERFKEVLTRFKNTTAAKAAQKQLDDLLINR